jgi:hypothetical protein
LSDCIQLNISSELRNCAPLFVTIETVANNNGKKVATGDFLALISHRKLTHGSPRNKMCYNYDKLIVRKLQTPSVKLHPLTVVRKKKASEQLLNGQLNWSMRRHIVKGGRRGASDMPWLASVTSEKTILQFD